MASTMMRTSHVTSGARRSFLSSIEHSYVCEKGLGAVARERAGGDEALGVRLGRGK